MKTLRSLAFRSVPIGRFRIGRTTLHASIVGALALVPALSPAQSASQSDVCSSGIMCVHTINEDGYRFGEIYFDFGEGADVFNVGSSTSNRRLTGISNARLYNDAVNLGQLEAAGLATSVGIQGDAVIHKAVIFSTDGANNKAVDFDGARLTQIAEGKADSDAVNVKQFKDAGLIDENGKSLNAVTFNTDGTKVDLRHAQLKNVADGTEDTDAVNLRQLKANGLIGESGRVNAVLYNNDQSVVTLMGPQGSLLTGLRDGRVEVGSLDAINGGQLASIRDDLQNKIDRVDNRVDNLPAPIAPSPGPGNDQSVGTDQGIGIDVDTGMAPGNDAETLAATNAYTDTKTSQSSTYTDTQVAQANQYTDVQAAAATASANRYTDQRIDALNQTIDQFRSDVNQRFQRQDVRMDRMGAMSAATAQMVMSSSGLQTKNHVGVGIGVQNGRSALAVGYSRAVSPSMRASFGGSASGGEVSAGAGMGIGW